MRPSTIRGGIDDRDTLPDPADAMSVRVMDAVFRLSEATGNDRLVLLAIADEANDDGCNAYPGIPLIAQKVRLPERTVRRCLDRLDELGELRRIYPEKRGRGHFTRYEVLVGKGDTLSAQKGGRKGAEGGQKEAERGRKEDTPPPLTSTDAEYPGPLPMTLDPTTAPPAAPTAKPGKRTQLPEPFFVTAPMRQWAAETVPHVDYRTETEQFTDHHRAKGSLMKDWPAAWRTWMRNAARFHAQRNGHHRPSTVEQSWTNILNGPKHGIR